MSLALKKSAKQQQSDTEAGGSSSTSPLSGLDAASIAAAQQQIDAFTNDVLPKVFFIWGKAMKERGVYIQDDEQTDDKSKASSGSDQDASASANQSRKELEELAKSMGGQVMTASELGLPSSRQLRKLPGLGVGSTWTRALRTHVQAVSTAIAQLGEACMDDRTKKAVKAAKIARERREGGAALTAAEEATPQAARTPAALRQQCLSRTAAVWEACDEASKTLPMDNVAAVRTRWAQRRALMEDGEREMSEEAKVQPSGNSTAAEQDDEFGLSTLGGLDERDRQLLGKVLPLIRLGRLLHDRTGELCLTDGEALKLDVDELDECAEAVATAQDDLVAAVLYDERPEREDDEDEENDQEGGEGWDRSAVAEDYLMAAQRLVEASAGKEKAMVALQEMRRLYEGIPKEEWVGGDALEEGDDEQEDEE